MHKAMALRLFVENIYPCHILGRIEGGVEGELIETVVVSTSGWGVVVAAGGLRVVTTGGGVLGIDVVLTPKKQTK